MICQAHILFSPKFDAVGKPGERRWHKILNSLCRLGCTASDKMMDEQCRLSSTSQRIALKSFPDSIIAHYEPEFLNQQPGFEEYALLNRCLPKACSPVLYGQWIVCILYWTTVLRNGKNNLTNWWAVLEVNRVTTRARMKRSECNRARTNAPTRDGRRKQKGTPSVRESREVPPARNCRWIYCSVP